MRATRIGCGAGFAGDRLDAAVDLLRDGELDFLVLECLAERTIALDTLERLAHPELGYDPLLESRLRPLLPLLAEHGARLVTNLGAANPRAAGRRVHALACELGLALRVAVVIGDDVLDRIDPEAQAWEGSGPLAAHGRLLSANAYLGAAPIVEALDAGADVVITGRVADPSLFLAPLASARGWDLNNLELVAHGTLVGHLLECGAQVTGGYFADPPFDEVPRLEAIGFPIAEVDETRAIVTKLPGTGGRVARPVVLQQLTYEILDPAAYPTPDVVADFSGVTVTDLGADRVEVFGARGAPPPEDVKVSVGFAAGFRCEAEISYAGTGARRRSELALHVVTSRMGVSGTAIHAEVIGTDPMIGEDGGLVPGSGECLLRLSTTVPSRQEAERLGREVTALYTNGPAGGGGIRVHVTETVGIVSTSLPRIAVPATVEFADGVPTCADQSQEVQLRAVAHARAGDKGSVSTLALIVRRKEWYDLICEQVTAGVVARQLGPRIRAVTERHELPSAGALIFVCQRPPGDTVTSSLHRDMHGKTLSSRLLDLRVALPPTAS